MMDDVRSKRYVRESLCENCDRHSQICINDSPERATTSQGLEASAVQKRQILISPTFHHNTTPQSGGCAKRCKSTNPHIPPPLQIIKRRLSRGVRIKKSPLSPSVPGYQEAASQSGAYKKIPTLLHSTRPSRGLFP